jgi:hypothetical protein
LIEYFFAEGKGAYCKMGEMTKKRRARGRQLIYLQPIADLTSALHCTVGLIWVFEVDGMII